PSQKTTKEKSKSNTYSKRLIKCRNKKDPHPTNQVSIKNNKYIDTLLSSHTTPPPHYSSTLINEHPFRKAARPTLHTQSLEHKPEHCVVHHNTANQTATQATSATHQQQPPTTQSAATKSKHRPYKVIIIPARQTKNTTTRTNIL
ncbi:hypothetical protein QP907_05185, partial [Corynebacterium pseudodiphtheriticum]|uniref:hypothetical protein n=1 Tax=Corynebacterium pseudodiphtheriticum TaxID=37637 RepID=UPI0025507117